jgi:hypothetical protein
VFPIAAIVTLDPAAIGPCGVAVRMTAPLTDPQRFTLRIPEFVFEGDVFSTTMHDDLTSFLAQRVEQGARVVLVVEDSMYGARKTARHLGRAIGVIESVLCDVNLTTPRDTRYVEPRYWRAAALLPRGVEPKGRDEFKRVAIDTVDALYKERLGPDAAEAILINDYVVLVRHEWWRGRVKQQPAKPRRAAA